jgi:hypothetical protein
LKTIKKNSGGRQTLKIHEAAHAIGEATPPTKKNNHMLTNPTVPNNTAATTGAHKSIVSDTHKVAPQARFIEAMRPLVAALNDTHSSRPFKLTGPPMELNDDEELSEHCCISITIPKGDWPKRPFQRARRKLQSLAFLSSLYPSFGWLHFELKQGLVMAFPKGDASAFCYLKVSSAPIYGYGDLNRWVEWVIDLMKAGRNFGPDADYTQSMSEAQRARIEHAWRTLLSY